MNRNKIPVISIIVPVYNVECYIRKCIDSILAQTFTDFELILVNDGSTDNCGKICDEYSLRDERITVVHKSNEGLSATRNCGIEKSKGSYLSFIDADDYIAPGMIEKLYELIVEYDADISECGYISVFKDKEVLCEFGKGIEFGEGNYLIRKFIVADIFYGVVTKLFKASLFTNIKFPVGRIFEEVWMTLNFCLDYLKYVRTDTPMYYYVQRENSIIQSEVTPYKAREYVYILENQIDLIKTKVKDNELKEKLYKRIMEKSIFTYLGMALSNKKVLRQYSISYRRRMNYSIMDCIRSTNIPLKNKLSFIFCKAGLCDTVRFIKNLFTRL